MPSNIAIDTSLLAHALVPSQRTDDADQALAQLLDSDDIIVIAPALLTEFSSLLRKLVNQQKLTRAQADRTLDDVLTFDVIHDAVSAERMRRAWEIAGQLGQGDTFDAMAYAVAEAFGGELWTCDQRFANAARQRGLPGVRFIP